jgi:hypothetical protein
MAVECGQSFPNRPRSRLKWFPLLLNDLLDRWQPQSCAKAFVLNSGSKIFVRISGLIPGPVSANAAGPTGGYCIYDNGKIVAHQPFASEAAAKVWEQVEKARLRPEVPSAASQRAGT